MYFAFAFGFFTFHSLLILIPCSLFPNAGERFYAHRIALLASSDAFRAMFDGGYKVNPKDLHRTIELNGITR